MGFGTRGRGRGKEGRKGVVFNAFACLLVLTAWGFVYSGFFSGGVRRVLVFATLGFCCGYPPEAFGLGCS